MNILISCPGRMVELVNILKKEFAKAGFGVITTGNSNRVAGLYAADKAYIVPSVEDEDYISCLLEICRQNEVRAILTLLDKDILEISKAAQDFRRLGIIPIMVNHEVAQICDNKFSMYEFMVAHGFKCAKTYCSLEDFNLAYDKKEIAFPVFVKPMVGDSGRGVMKCHNMDELARFLSINPDLIVQEFLDGPQYDIDVYVDTISGKMVSIFAKEKLTMLNGVSNKAISINDANIFSLSEQLVQSLGAVGPIDIEMIKVKGEYYVNEVNPRLEASYPGAYACGVYFGDLIVNNINGIENIANIGNYESDILILKYDRVFIKTPDDMLAF